MSEHVAFVDVAIDRVPAVVAQKEIRLARSTRAGSGIAQPIGGRDVLKIVVGGLHQGTGLRRSTECVIENDIGYARQTAKKVHAAGDSGPEGRIRCSWITGREVAREIDCGGRISRGVLRAVEREHAGPVARIHNCGERVEFGRARVVRVIKHRTRACADGQAAVSESFIGQAIMLVCMRDPDASFPLTPLLSQLAGIGCRRYLRERFERAHNREHAARRGLELCGVAWR
jgi:hypothetical protein